MTPPETFLKVRVGTQDILEVLTEHSVDAGIRYVVFAAGIVPFFEEHDARIEAGYTLPQWSELSWEERALEVLHFRMRHKIELVQRDAEAAATKSELKKSKK